MFSNSISPSFISDKDIYIYGVFSAAFKFFNSVVFTWLPLMTFFIKSLNFTLSLIFIKTSNKNSVKISTFLVTIRL